MPRHRSPTGRSFSRLIGQRVAEAQKTILEAQIKMRETDRQIADLTRKLSSLAPAPEQRTEVKVFVNATGALDADLIIRYQVGTASWTPFYDARLATGTRDQAPRLQLVRRASIQQRTGENWDDVALSLSTARPNAGSAAPDLRPMTVDYAPDAPHDRASDAGAAGRQFARAQPSRPPHRPPARAAPSRWLERREAAERATGHGRGAAVPSRSMPLPAGSPCRPPTR